MSEPIIPAALEDNGWKFKEKCSGCQTVKKWKYWHPEKPDYFVRIAINRGTFEILKQATVIVRSSPNSMLDAVLKDLK